MKTGVILTLKISETGLDGDGIALAGSDFKVYVKNAVEGDVVKAVITEVHKSYAKAETVNILRFSKLRTKPFCKYYDLCGGCQIQTLSYEAQLILKRKILENVLKPFDCEIFDTLPSRKIFHYRNKALIPFAGDGNGGITAGIYEKNSHKIINCPDCKTEIREKPEILKVIISHLKRYDIKPYDEKNGTGVLRHVLIRKGFFTGEIMVSLIVNAQEFPYEKLLTKQLLKAVPEIKTICVSSNLQKTNVINGKDFHAVYGGGFITDLTGGIKYKISPLSFFQINAFQTERLYEKVSEFAALTGSETVFDVYCGVGTISLFLAKKAKKVYGVEIVAQAVENAKENAALNNIQNAEFFCGKAEEKIPELIETQHIKADIVIVDPPRQGCDKALLETIAALKPQKFIYVSCNPQTFARDVKFLTDRGFRLKRVQPVDMFPHTTHIECVGEIFCL